MLCCYPTFQTSNYPPPPLRKHGLVSARRPRVTVVLMGFSDDGFYGQKFIVS